MLLAGELPEMAALAARTGVGRTSLYRWFGDRDALVGEVLAGYLEAQLEDGYARSRARGARRVGRAIEQLLRDAASQRPLLDLLRTHPTTMLDIIMRPDGAVRTRSIAVVEDLIQRERDAGRYRPALEPAALAFALVVVGQSFMWARAATGAEPDLDRTLQVTEELLRAERP